MPSKEMVLQVQFILLGLESIHDLLIWKCHDNHKKYERGSDKGISFFVKNCDKFFLSSSQLRFTLKIEQKSGGIDMNNRYTITEAANILNVHAHTLRYWEEELHLTIPRNELGHRVYYQEQLDMFRNIKGLKEEGYQLNAIRAQVGTDMGDYTDGSCDFRDYTASKEEKMQKFQEMISEAVRQAIMENKEEWGKELTEGICYEMRTIAHLADQKQEERYLRLDEAIRNQVKKSKRKSRFKWGQREKAAKLKEELNRNKKEAVTQATKIVTET
ncbi:MAG: MerR family transcriptional regulator [Lachnospiraceae bacterium]|nr:MerR family transcriptional regulator [Lachnospiraceae bacterium]